MAERKHSALRETQLRLKALVCETVSLRESLQRESKKKGAALDAAKRQEHAAKGTNRKLKEQEFLVRYCSLQLGNTCCASYNKLKPIRSAYVLLLLLIIPQSWLVKQISCWLWPHS
jgi:hypothetical protein